DDRVHFEIRDAGPGIAPDQQRAIFEPFHQASSAAAAQGTGLGLPISQRIVDLLGGRIEVESTPGRGHPFWFDLDFPEVRPAAAGQGCGLGRPLGQRIVDLLGGRSAVAGTPGRGSGFWFDLAFPEVRPAAARGATVRTITGYRGPRRRILVTDDEPTNRAVLR